jgi:hypothetical protein
MAATTTTAAAVSSAKKRTSEDAGFFDSPPPKHRKLNTARALALSPATRELDNGAALLFLANDQSLTAQEQADFDRLQRTWMIEFSSPLITPGPDAPLPPGFRAPRLIHSTQEISLWRLSDCKRYEGCKARLSFYLMAGTQLALAGLVQFGGSCKHFQGCMRPKACEARFVFDEGDFGVEIDEEDDDEDYDDDDEEDDDEEDYDAFSDDEDDEGDDDDDE